MINLCESQRSGPVHIDICKDVFTQEVELTNIFTYEEALYKEESNLLQYIKKMHNKKGAEN